VYSQRRFSVGSAAVLAALGFGPRWDVANAEDSKSDPSEIAKWMDAWMARDSGAAIGIADVESDVYTAHMETA
jgi:hypothetical protein